MRYRPLADPRTTPDDEPTATRRRAICDAVDELRAEGPGDILVFLSGEREIRDTADALRRAADLADTGGAAAVRAAVGGRAAPGLRSRTSGRRVVLATNVAETSLTVPGIRYVIDPGTARISRYSQRTKVQRLPIEPISQAVGEPAQGPLRAASDGICIRLYSEEDFALAAGVHRPGDPAHQPGRR